MNYKISNVTGMTTSKINGLLNITFILVSIIVNNKKIYYLRGIIKKDNRSILEQLSYLYYISMEYTNATLY